MNLSASGAVVLLTLLWAADAAAQGSIGVRARRWQAELSGDLKVDDDGSSGSEIDASHTLGFDDKEDFNEIHLTMGLPILGRFNFQYLKGEFDGTNTLTSDITFGGSTFTATTQIDSELDFEAYTLLWQFGASAPGVVGADVGAGGIAGLKYFNIQAMIEDRFGNSEEAEIKGPLPVIGAYFRTNLASFLALDAQVHGIKFFDTFNLGLEGLFYDFTVGVDVKIKGLFAGAGYRLFVLDLDYENSEDVKVDIEMDGFYFEAGLSF